MTDKCGMTLMAGGGPGWYRCQLLEGHQPPHQSFAITKSGAKPYTICWPIKPPEHIEVEEGKLRDPQGRARGYVPVREE